MGQFSQAIDEVKEKEKHPANMNVFHKRTS